MPIGIANDERVVARPAGGCRSRGRSVSSSANGASVASIRAPRTTIASSVSPILCSATSPAACSASGFERSTCGFMSACVVDRSRSRIALLVGDEVLRALLVAPPRPDVGAPGEAGERDVQVVGRAPHHPGGERRGQLDRAPAALEVLARARDEVGDVDEARRRRATARASRPRARAGGRRRAPSTRAAARSSWMLERVRDLLAVQPDLALVAVAGPSRNCSPVRAAASGCVPAFSGRELPSGSLLVSAGFPSASRPCRSDSIASASKRKYERGGRMPPDVGRVRGRPATRAARGRARAAPCRSRARRSSSSSGMRT